MGQLLYLEAEAAGLRGTGIGCFFDDEVHRAIGLVDRRLAKPLPFHRGRGAWTIRGCRPRRPTRTRPGPNAGSGAMATDDRDDDDGPLRDAGDDDGESWRRDLPEPPDAARVHELRRRLRQDRRDRGAGPPGLNAAGRAARTRRRAAARATSAPTPSSR